MRLKPRRRARIAGRHRRPRPYRAVPDLAPQTWRAWEAQNGGKRWYRRLPLAIEWALEWFVHWLRGLALFDLLELAGKLTVVVAIIFWFLEADQRAKQAEEAIKERHYRAWELINAAAGKAGDGGRRDALQDLNKDGISLAAAPLEKAYLMQIDLRGGALMYANLQGAILANANLQGATLTSANLQNTELAGANLQKAWLAGANLQGAHLDSANLQGAVLMSANLQGAGFHSAILHGATFYDADLRGARNLTQEQLNEAMGDNRAQLPMGLTRPAHWINFEGVDNRGEKMGREARPVTTVRPRNQ